MKPIALITALAGLSINLLAEEKPRIWTNAKGQTITATLLSYDETKETAEISREDGKAFHLSYEQLSTTDQDYIDGYVVDRAVAPKLAGKKSDTGLGDPSPELTKEAELRGVALKVSEIFQVSIYNTQFANTQCLSVGLRSKLPSRFQVEGNVHQQKGGKDRELLKGTLTLVKFIDTSHSGGGNYRMPVFKATNLRKAPPREVRRAKEGR